MIKEPYKILIVDDNLDITEIIETHITDLYGENKFIIKRTDTGAEALKLLAADSYNILITDLKMPNMSGEAVFLEALKMRKGIQVIVLSGLETYVTALNCYLDGAAGFVTKPFTPDKLKKAVDLAVDRLNFWKDFINDTIKKKTGAKE